MKRDKPQRPQQLSERVSDYIAWHIQEIEELQDRISKLEAVIRMEKGRYKKLNEALKRYRFT